MASVSLTPKELQLLKAVGKYINTAAVDWAKVAEEADFPAPKRARDKWYPLRDKLFGAGVAADADATPKKKAAPKRKAAGESGGSAKKKGKKATADEVEGGDDDDDDDETKSPVKLEPESENEELV